MTIPICSMMGRWVIPLVSRHEVVAQSMANARCWRGVSGKAQYPWRISCWHHHGLADRCQRSGVIELHAALPVEHPELFPEQREVGGDCGVAMDAVHRGERR